MHRDTVWCADLMGICMKVTVTFIEQHVSADVEYMSIIKLRHAIKKVSLSRSSKILHIAQDSVGVVNCRYVQSSLFMTEICIVS